MRSPIDRMLTWYRTRRRRRKQPPVIVRQTPELFRSDYWREYEPRRPRPGEFGPPDRNGLATAFIERNEHGNYRRHFQGRKAAPPMISGAPSARLILPRSTAIWRRPNAVASMRWSRRRCALAKADKALAAAELARERGRARRAELNAGSPNASLQREARHVAGPARPVAARADQLVEVLRREYPRIASRNGRVAQRVRDCEQAVRGINGDIDQAGDVGRAVEKVVEVETRALPQSPTQQSDIHSVLHWTRLKKFEGDPTIPYWLGVAYVNPFVAPVQLDIPPFISSSPRVALK